MKDKNRFSSLLKHLTSVAKLKNYTLAKELQYDESYISKWITGSLLPTEKTSEKIFRDISRCVVFSLDQDGRETLYAEYQVDQDRDLENAIFDNLAAEFDYVINLKASTGSEVAAKTSFYPELTLAQYLKKMRHPVLRQVKSLDVILATDILSLDHHYQLALAELESNPSINMVQRSYPGVHFSMLINLESPGTDHVHNVQFILNLLTNLSSVNFQLYSIPQTQGKILFTVKDAYAISGMIMDESHCLSVTATEDAKNANALYDRLQSLCGPETLAVQRTTIPDMIQSNAYTQYCFARNQRCTLSHLTEHFLPEDIFASLLEDYCRNHKDADPAKIKSVYKLTSTILGSMKIRLMLDEDGLNEFAVTGTVDFLGDKAYLSPQQRMRCLEHLASLAETNRILDYRILHGRRTLSQPGMSFPTLFLSDSICYVRIQHSGLTFNVNLINQKPLEKMFCKCFDTLWDDPARVDADRHSAVELMRYLTQMVQVQILAEQ